MTGETVALSTKQCPGFSLCISPNMPDVIQYIQHALFACHPNHRDGGVGCRKKEVAFQSQRFGGIGVDDAPMREGDHALADMPAGDLIEGRDDASAENLRGFAVGDVIPVARFPGYAHDITLAFVERLVKTLQIMRIFRQRANIPQPDLLDAIDDNGRQTQGLGQRCCRLLAAPQRAAIDRIEMYSAETLGQVPRLLSPNFTERQIVIDAARNNFIRLRYRVPMTHDKKFSRVFALK